MKLGIQLSNKISFTSLENHEIIKALKEMHKSVHSMPKKTSLNVILNKISEYAKSMQDIYTNALNIYISDGNSNSTLLLIQYLSKVKVTQSLIDNIPGIIEHYFTRKMKTYEQIEMIISDFLNSNVQLHHPYIAEKIYSILINLNLQENQSVCSITPAFHEKENKNNLKLVKLEYQMSDTLLKFLNQYVCETFKRMNIYVDHLSENYTAYAAFSLDMMKHDFDTPLTLFREAILILFNTIYENEKNIENFHEIAQEYDHYLNIYVSYEFVLQTTIKLFIQKKSTLELTTLIPDFESLYKMRDQINAYITLVKDKAKIILRQVVEHQNQMRINSKIQEKENKNEAIDLKSFSILAHAALEETESEVKIRHEKNEQENPIDDELSKVMSPLIISDQDIESNVAQIIEGVPESYSIMPMKDLHKNRTKRSYEVSTKNLSPARKEEPSEIPNIHENALTSAQIKKITKIFENDDVKFSLLASLTKSLGGQINEKSGGSRKKITIPPLFECEKSVTLTMHVKHKPGHNKKLAPIAFVKQYRALLTALGLHPAKLNFTEIHSTVKYK